MKRWLDRFQPSEAALQIVIALVWGWRAAPASGFLNF